MGRSPSGGGTISPATELQGGRLINWRTIILQMLSHTWSDRQAGVGLSNEAE